MSPSHVPDTGAFRLKLTTPDRTFLVGNFGSLGGARRFAHDLVGAWQRGGGPELRGLAVQHKNRGTWKPAGFIET